MSVTDEQTESGTQQAADYDAVVIGAGFAGMYQLHLLRDELGLDVTGIEKADDVGGTWYWNRYPGARCDSESHIYCYSFSEDLLEEWEWSRRYPKQPEILEYLRFAADYLDVRKDIQFETEITSASFDQDAGRWEIETDEGDRVTSQFLITAVGCLSEPFLPDFEGIESFEGFWSHTARWPHDPVDFEGKRVAVIGTGATGIQAIPEVAKSDPEHLTVFQRTPNYAIPARDRPIGEDDLEEIKENYDTIWKRAHESGGGFPFASARETVADLTMEEIEELLEPRWQEGGFRFGATVEDLTINEESNEKISEYLRDRIRETVDDPELAEKLCPAHHYGTKRPPLHTDYYETYNRDHVSLVDVNETPIERITPEGIQTSDEHHEFDIIIYATGFDAMTGALTAIDIRGRDGQSLEEKWADGPVTYLGLTVHGFPNMFTITGPQSPSVLANMPVPIQHHAEWIADAVEHLLENDVRLIEPTEEAEDAWTAHNLDLADKTLHTETDSWRTGANVPGKTEVFAPYAGGVHSYHEIIQEVTTKDYEGFELTESVDELGDQGRKPQLSVMEGD